MSQFCPVFYPNLHAGLLILFTGIFSAKSTIKFTVSLTITSHKNVDDFLASFLCNTRIPTDVLIDHLLIVLLSESQESVFLVPALANISPWVLKVRLCTTISKSLTLHNIFQPSGTLKGHSNFPSRYWLLLESNQVIVTLHSLHFYLLPLWS